MATTFIPFRWRSEAAKWAATGVVTRAAGDAPPARPGRPATHRWSRTLLLESALRRSDGNTGANGSFNRSSNSPPRPCTHPLQQILRPIDQRHQPFLLPTPPTSLAPQQNLPERTQLPPQITHPHQAQLRHPRADQADQPARGVVPSQRRVRGATAVCIFARISRGRSRSRPARTAAREDATELRGHGGRCRAVPGAARSCGGPVRCPATRPAGRHATFLAEIAVH